MYSSALSLNIAPFLDLFTESQFEENLTMPSMSNYDSLMEPYDEFHSGLQFPDYTDSSKADTLNILDAAANNVDTDEEMDDLPYEPEVTKFPNEGNLHAYSANLAHLQSFGMLYCIFYIAVYYFLLYYGILYYIVSLCIVFYNFICCTVDSRCYEPRREMKNSPLCQEFVKSRN